MALSWLLGVRPLLEKTRLLIVVDQFEELFRYHRTGNAAPARPDTVRSLHKSTRQDDPKLGKHKDKHGYPCPGRTGFYVDMRY